MMPNLLLFLLVTTLFMLIAILIADGILRKAALKQDLVWRATLIAIAILPCSLFVRLAVPRFALPIPIVAMKRESVGGAMQSGEAKPRNLGQESQVSSMKPEMSPKVDSMPGLVEQPTIAKSKRETVQQSNEPTNATAAALPRGDKMRSLSDPASLPGQAVGTSESELNDDLVLGLQWGSRPVVTLLSGFFLLWILGTCVKFGCQIVGYARQWQWWRSSRSSTGSLWDEVASEMNQGGVQRRIQLRFSSKVSTPILIGLINPIVLIPASMRKMDNRSMMEQVLVHERSHLERGDHWMNLLLQFIGAILWFHPLYYWMRQRMLWLREILCDAEVLRRSNPIQYSETLLMFSRHSVNRQHGFASIGMAMPKSMLGRRIAVLLQESSRDQLEQVNLPLRRVAWTTAILMSLVSGLLQFTSAATPSASPSSTTEENLQVRGKVLLPDGKPAFKATVHLLRTGKGAMTLPVKTETVETDVQGRYRFEKVAVGTYQVWAETKELTSLEEKLRGKRLEIEATKVETDLDLNLHEGCRYLVKVIDKVKQSGVPNADLSFGWTDIDRHYSTGQEGTVEIAGLAMDEWYFVVRAKGYGIQYRKLPKQPLGSRTELKFELELGVDLEGTIRDEKGVPVVGANVGASAIEGGMTPGLGRTVTDQAGRFELASLPRGIEFRLSVSANDFLRFSKTMSSPLDQSRIDGDLVLTKRPYGGDCIVKVFNEKGDPIQEATIENTGSSSADVRSAKTNEKGVARLSDLYTSYRGTSGTVRANGYVAQQVELVSGSVDQPGEIVVRLKKGESIRGRLVKPNGEPAAKVWVFYNRGESGFGELGGRVDTDNEGRFQIDGLPNPCTFTFYTPAPYAPIRDRTLLVGGKEEVVVTMEPEGVIRVRAIDSATGKAIPEFNVRIGFPKDRRPKDPVVSLSGELIEQGKNILGDAKEFRLGQLPLGLPLQITVSAKGYEKRVLPRVEATVEKESDLLDVELTREDESMFRKVTGKLVDPSGNPVAGAVLKLIVGKNEAEPLESPLRRWTMISTGQVQRDPACLQFLSTTSNRDGSFKFERVVDGNWMEIVHTGGKVANGRHILRIPSDASDLEGLELESSLAGSIQVAVDHDKYPTAHKVSLHCERPQQAFAAFDYTIKTIDTKEKILVIDDLPPGSYSIVLQAKPIDNGDGTYTSKSIKSIQFVIDDVEPVLVRFE